MNTAARHRVRRYSLSAVAVVLCAGFVGCAAEPAPGATGSSTPIPPAQSASPTSAAPAQPGETAAPPPVTASPTAPAGLAPVDVVLTTVDVIDGAIEATGIVGAAPEAGGTCTLEVRRDDTSHTAAIDATSGPQTNFCGVMTIPASVLSPGTWDLTLTYTSPTSYGRADSEVSVP
ncbi:MULTISPECIES: hypothetical protein [unclassified Microbacterium]|uniref:hypothetical protein n=1 Tax=unclassified Microbacterium TaxID=2609290 RepID=UPI00214B8C93|nr:MULTISPECIES: hypothetical protein [unclassified Microbacterium]MCR2785208.1 hypothetical protein [Microbacterium sp. zg.B96]MDL5352570.1 hypothetical protein [Microbacterium sp. zg-YB36]WIM16740.1 hypothetical protein QNO11_03600 [Microbacterium sp. zg-B96]